MVTHLLRLLALAGSLALFVAGAAQPADAAKPRDPAIYLNSAGLTPDSQAVIVRLDVYCSEQQTVVDAPGQGGPTPGVGDGPLLAALHRTRHR